MRPGATIVKVVTPDLEIDDLRSQLAEAKERLGRSMFQCAECGSTGPFRDVVYPSTPNGPEEYDIACEECGSLKIEESPREAFHHMLLRADEANARAEDAEEKLAEVMAAALAVVNNCEVAPVMAFGAAVSDVKGTCYWCNTTEPHHSPGCEWVNLKDTLERHGKRKKPA